MDLGHIGIWSVALRSMPAPEAATAAKELENLGYSAVWMPGRGEDIFKRVRELLAATQRIVVATGIISIWDFPAAVVATQHHALAQDFPGRFLLGLGVSHGRPLTYDAMLAYLDELDRAPTPVPASERILAALGPRMLKLARNRSLGAHPYNVPVSHTGRARAILGPEALLAPEQAVILEPVASKARESARQFLEFYLKAPNYTNNFLREGFTPDDLLNGGSDRLIDAIIAWGDLPTIRARLNEHLSAGASHLAIQILGGDRQTLPLAQLRELAAAVM